MPANDLELLDVPPDTGATFCEPFHVAHISRDGLAFCRTCRVFHHADWTCLHAVQARHETMSVTVPGWRPASEDDPREYCDECEIYHDSAEDDCPRYVIECGDCDTEHAREDDCPREFCDDCDDYHDRDRWGNAECPGWYCEDCGDYHEYGEDCPEPYCDDCGGHHAPGDCEADCDCGCESPRPVFAIRNDGELPLANDTRAAIALPADEISDVGLREIREYLLGIYHSDSDLNADFYYLAFAFGNALGCKWQTKQGNYTKRLSRFAYQTYGGLKLTPEVMSQVGCIARDHSRAISFDIEVTRNLNMSAADFYHEDSCWFGSGSYAVSRCALKTNGGFGLRSFAGYSVTGRTWVMPLRLADGGLVPTFDTETPDAFVVFNGYGDLAGYAPARIMAAMAGWTYKKIDFVCNPMYINAGGYLIAPEQIIQDTSDLNLSVDQHAAYTDEREFANAA